MEAIYCGVYPILPKRLTYPELLPDEWHRNHLYDNEDGLYELVKLQIKDMKGNRTNLNRDWIHKFDWKSMGGEYDKLFSLYL